jgi:ATP-dependent Lon protease
MLGLGLLGPRIDGALKMSSNLYHPQADMELPPGYVIAARSDLAFDLPLKGLAVPKGVVADLNDAAMRAAAARAMEKAAAREESAVTEAAETAGRMPSAPPAALEGPKPSHYVDPSTFERGWRQPRGHHWLRVWDPAAVLRQLKLHNSATGYNERDARARDAAVFRHLSKGPWRKCVSPKHYGDCIRQLREECPHMSAAIDLIAAHLALSAETRTQLRIPPMLLVGQPGVGKSYFARRVAELLGTPIRFVDFASQQTNSMLHGSDRHWSNTKPGALFDLIVMGDVANPVIVLDEIDKASAETQRYDPLGPLHLALEPSTARCTRDLSTEIEFDASAVVYIATANSLRRLPDSLLSRMQLIHCEAPDAKLAFDMAKSITGRVMAHGKGRHFSPVSTAVIRELAGRTPRDIVGLLERAMARAALAGRRELLLDDLRTSNCPSPVH